jgi:succinate dehydrogenase / fumarate reductase cytochrome b subunit
MWLINSSIGRKLIMSISGAALVLFLLFHATMNLVAIISEDGYNMICEFLGANWYALVATAGLAALVVVHILYAFFITWQNYRARGNKRYAVSTRQEDVEWSSKNMLVLGVVIVLGMGLHLFNFWYKMQFTEIMHAAGAHLNDIELATNGVHWIKETFSCPVYVVLYLVWLGAIWFHLTHGVWSALHTLGLNNNTWMPRVKCISNIVSTLVVLMFAAVVFYYGLASLGCCGSSCCAA